MNRNMTHALAGGIALLLSGTALAATHSGLINSSRIENQKVTNMQGQPIGDIDGLLLDPATGTVQYALIDVGGQNDCPVPWSAFKMTRHPSGKVILSLDASPEKLAKAPRFSGVNINELFTPEGSDAVRTYWQPGAGMIAGHLMPPPPVAEGPASTPSSRESSDQPQNYYDVNRDILAPSAEPQNNAPVGIAPTPPQQKAPSSLPDQSNRAYDQVTDMDAPPEPPRDSPASQQPQSGQTVPGY